VIKGSCETVSRMDGLTDLLRLFDEDFDLLLSAAVPYNCHVLVVCPVKAGVFSRRQSCHGKSQKPCSSDGRVKGNRYSEAHRHYHL